MPPPPSVFDVLARVGKALASPRRLELLDLLAQAPRTVEVLAAQAGMGVANTSQHLQVLARAGLVERHKRAQWVEYRLAGDDVLALYLDLRDLAARGSAASARPAAAPGQPDTATLRAMALAGEAIVLDVRPVEEFAAGHLPGARSVPLDQLDRVADQLAGGRPIIAYCRGPYCVFARKAVDRLSARGHVAHALDEGPPEWRRQGLELVVGA